MSSIRIEDGIECQACDGTGRHWASRYGGNDPDVWDAGVCERCHGSTVERCSYCDEAATHELKVTGWRGKRSTDFVCKAHYDEQIEEALIEEYWI